MQLISGKLMGVIFLVIAALVVIALATGYKDQIALAFNALTGSVGGLS